MEKNDVKLVNVQHKQQKPPKKDIYDIMDIIKSFLNKNKKNILTAIAVIGLLCIIIYAFNDKNDKKPNERETPSTEADTTQQETEEDTTEESTTPEETTPEETEPVLTLTPESDDSQLKTLISNFYQAYITGGTLEGLSQYIDSTNGINENRLNINKKYIEQVSDFVCYKSDLNIIASNHTVMIVTYKIKLYNYEELLPSIDVLFLVEGDEGYRVHNLTVDDAFEKDKVINDSNFQILSKQITTELDALLTNNADLKKVYDLYLNPDNASTEATQS